MGSYPVAYNVYSQPFTGPFDPFLKVHGNYHLSYVGSAPGEVTEIHEGTHQNDNSETYVNLGPDFFMTVADQTVRLKTGDVFQVPPDVRHGNFETPKGYSALIIEGNEGGNLGANYGHQIDSYRKKPPAFGRTLDLSA